MFYFPRFNSLYLFIYACLANELYRKYKINSFTKIFNKSTIQNIQKLKSQELLSYIANFYFILDNIKKNEIYVYINLYI